jgi:serine/threonine-protein kinase RsbW
MTRAPRRASSRAPAIYSAVKLVRPCEPATVTALRHRAATFAVEQGADPSLVADVALAISEAVTNVVKYAYGKDGEGNVELVASSQDGWLELRVTDAGEGFREGPSDGLGLGLQIIAHLCTDLTIDQEDGGTEVRMRFTLPES